MDRLAPSNTANPVDGAINNNSNNNNKNKNNNNNNNNSNSSTIEPPVDNTTANNGNNKSAATVPPTFVIPPYPISPVGKAPNLTLNTALGPDEVVDGADKAVEEDGLIARQVESARSVAGDAALALTAAKKVVNESIAEL